jgi:hypothetical protein
MPNRLYSCLCNLLKHPVVAALALILLTSQSAVAGGGLTIGLVQLNVPKGETEDKRLAALIANDLLPQTLEQGFSQRYGIYPFVTSVPRNELTDLGAFVAGAREKRLFEVLIVPELTFRGKDPFYELKVFDLRQDSGKSERTFVAAPDRPDNVSSIEKGLLGASERIAAALFDKSAWQERDRSVLEGLVYVWCIIPGSEQSAIVAAELTVGLPFSLTKVASSRGLRLEFLGLGHSEYFTECRSRLSGDATQQSGVASKGKSSTFTLSGQLTNLKGDELWLRLFAEDRSIGQTFVLKPIKIADAKSAEVDPLAGSREKIAEGVIDALVESLGRNR